MIEGLRKGQFDWPDGCDMNCGTGETETLADSYLLLSLLCLYVTFSYFYLG